MNYDGEPTPSVSDFVVGVVLMLQPPLWACLALYVGLAGFS